MANAALKTKEQEAPPATVARKVTEIPPANVSLLEVQVRHFFIVLPAGIEFADLGSPDIFRKVQGGPNPLTRGDELTLQNHAGMWRCRATVDHANMSEVVISKPRDRVDFTERRTASYSNELGRVQFVGTGWCAVRISDGQRMGAIHTSERAAEDDVRAMAPRKI